LSGRSSISAPRWTSSRSTIETCSPRSSVCKRVIESKSSCPPRPTAIYLSWVGMSRSRPSWGSASRATAVDSADGLAASGSPNAPTAQDPHGRVRWLRPEIEEFLARKGLRYFFVDTHLVAGGAPIGTYEDRLVERRLDAAREGT